MLEGVVSESDVPGWIAGGGVELDGPVSAMLRSAPVLVESDAKLSEVVVPMLDADAVGVRSVGRFAGLVTTGGAAGIVESLAAGVDFTAHLERVAAVLLECGYVANRAVDHCASFAEWRARFRGWIEDPVGKQVFEARYWLDLWPVAGAPGVGCVAGSQRRHCVCAGARK